MFKTTIAAFAVIVVGIVVVLAMNEQSDFGTSKIAPLEPDEIDMWETFGISEWNFEVRYPGTELIASCPAYPSCYLGSPFLDGERYYSAEELPDSALRIDIGSYGSEDSAEVTDLMRWLKSQPEMFDTNARYDVVSVGYGYRGLRELSDDHETIYVSTGTGRLLSFELVPVTDEGRVLFEKIVSTISIGL